MAYFTDDDCTKKLKMKGDSNVMEPNENDLKEMDAECHELSSDASFHTSCQAGQGIVFRHYDNANCAPLREKKTVVAWDSCSKLPSVVSPPGKTTYVKVTGAMALKSAALALAAFAGSQF